MGEKFIEWFNKKYNVKAEEGKRITCVSDNHEDSNPSMYVYENYAYCWGCGLKIKKNEETFKPLLNHLFARFIELCKNDLPEEWALSRGYDINLLKELGIGLCTRETYTNLGREFESSYYKEHGLINDKGHHLWINRAIIPFSDDYFSGRSIHKESKFKNKFPKGLKKKPLIFEGEKGKPTIIAEGETTAIALKHIFKDHTIVGLGGVGSWSLISKLDINEAILCLDNDDAGFKCEKYIYDYLNSQNKIVKKIQFSKKYNDFDDLHYKYRNKCIEHFQIIDLKCKEDLIEMDSNSEQILKDKELFSKLINEIGKKVVKEGPAIKTILLTILLSRVENAIPSSSNLLVNDEGGVGKDYVVSKTIEIIPKDWWIKRTRITPTVLTYWKPVEDWNGQILYLEDISNTVFNCDVFKVMASGGSHATVVINQEAVDIEIIGKPVIIATSASANPNPETARRFPICSLNSDKSQTKEIINKKCENAETGNIIKYNESLSKALTLLKRSKVKIPFASYIKHIFPDDNTIMRTGIDRFLDYIKASCALYQFQRKKDNSGYLIAEGQDYNIAIDIFNNLSSTDSGYPISKDQQKVIDVMKILEVEKHKKEFSVSEIDSKVTFSERWLRTHLKRLSDLDILKVITKEVDFSKKGVSFYALKEFSKLKLIRFKELEAKYKDFKETSPKRTMESIEHDLRISNQPCSDLPTPLSVNENHIENRSINPVTTNDSIDSNDSNDNKSKIIIVQDIPIIVNPKDITKTIGPYKKEEIVEINKDTANLLISMNIAKALRNKELIEQ